MERILGAAISHLDDRRSEPDRDVLAWVDAGELGAAVQRLMKRHGARVHRYCRAALHDATLADDVHQQVFIQVLRDLPQFQRRSSVRDWILGIAHHRVLDAAKARSRSQARLAATDLAEIAELGPSPGDAIDEDRMLTALRAALARLDVAARSAVLLRYQLGMTFEEMAEVCGEKSGTLQARVNRALPRLRAMVERRMRRSR